MSIGSDRGWQSIGRVLSRRTAATLAVVPVVTLGLAIGLGRLDFATGHDSYIDPSSQVAKDNTRYQNLFGGESMVALFTVPRGNTVVDLFDAANVTQFREVESQIRTSKAVLSVVSPLTLLTWTQDLITKGVASEIIARTIQREQNPAAAAARQRDAQITILRLGAAGKQSFDNPAWVKFLVFGNDRYAIDASKKLVVPSDDALLVRKALRAFIPDSRHAILAAVLVGNAPLSKLAAGSDAVKSAFAGRQFDNATVTVTGTPTFLTDINNYLQGGMLTLGGIAVLVMIVVLVVAFGVRWRLLPLIGMVAGVAWGFGVFGFTGTKLSLVTIAGLPILIGLGIEFAIQIQNRIEEERSAEHARDPFAETLMHMGPPLVAATVAAVIAFLTVKVSKVPMVQDFGSCCRSVSSLSCLPASCCRRPSSVLVNAGHRRRRKLVTVGWRRFSKRSQQIAKDVEKEIRQVDRRIKGFIDQGEGATRRLVETLDQDFRKQMASVRQEIEHLSDQLAAVRNGAAVKEAEPKSVVTDIPSKKPATAKSTSKAPPKKRTMKHAA